MNRRQFATKTLHGLGGLLTLGAVPGCSSGPPASKVNRGRAGDLQAVLNGIDVLERQGFAPFQGLRLGLVTNHTGHDRSRRSTIDLLANAPGVKLTALFSPEHGIRGEADEKVGDTVDQKTGLPIHSLYGERRAPSAESLRGLDALVFDIQDIGCRFYTYPSTMALCLEAAAAAKIGFWVLDRVNPINGVALEGPLHKGARTFVAFHPVPLRHGMTVGELARLHNVRNGLAAKLTVVQVEGWRRDRWLDETGLPWTNPSPNMRSLAAATLYPGLGLHERALSVGRGTDRPFEWIGAPYIDEVSLAEALRDFQLAGVNFVPVRFTPTSSVFKDQACAGVAFVITDRERLKAVDLGIALALALERLYPNDFALNKLHTLLQHPPTIDAIRSGRPLAEIRQEWAADLAAFKRQREAFLLY